MLGSFPEYGNVVDDVEADQRLKEGGLCVPATAGPRPVRSKVGSLMSGESVV